MVKAMDLTTVNRSLASSHGEARRCPMCAVMEEEHAVKPWNRRVLESEHFVVIPSLGSLVEGWLLIVPRSHVLSAAALPTALLPELGLLKAEVRRILEREYGSVTFFEHGPASYRRQTGCGVDHAHIHAVPDIGNLLHHARHFLPPDVAFREGDFDQCRFAIEKGLDYLYAENLTGGAWIATSAQLGSQTFRKAIADSIGALEKFDWKAFPEVENIERTLGKLRTGCTLHEAAVA